MNLRNIFFGFLRKEKLCFNDLSIVLTGQLVRLSQLFDQRCDQVEVAD